MLLNHDIKEIEKFKHIFQDHINLPLTIKKEDGVFYFLADILNTEFDNFVFSVKKEGAYYYVRCRPLMKFIRQFDNVYDNNQYEIFSRTNSIEKSMMLLLNTFKRGSNTISSSELEILNLYFTNLSFKKSFSDIKSENKEEI